MNLSILIITTLFVGFLVYTIQVKWKLEQFEMKLFGLIIKPFFCSWCLCFQLSLITLFIGSLFDAIPLGVFNVVVTSGASTYLNLLISEWYFNK